MCLFLADPWTAVSRQLQELFKAQRIYRENSEQKRLQLATKPKENQRCTHLSCSHTKSTSFPLQSKQFVQATHHTAPHTTRVGPTSLIGRLRKVAQHRNLLGSCPKAMEESCELRLLLHHWTKIVATALLNGG